MKQTCCQGAKHQRLSSVCVCVCVCLHSLACVCVSTHLMHINFSENTHLKSRESDITGFQRGDMLMKNILAD